MSFSEGQRAQGPQAHDDLFHVGVFKQIDSDKDIALRDTVRLAAAQDIPLIN
jgi:hypothetical protein